jgi:hypothetical protein
VGAGAENAFHVERDRIPGTGLLTIRNRLGFARRLAIGMPLQKWQTGMWSRVRRVPVEFDSDQICMVKKAKAANIGLPDELMCLGAVK